MTVVSESLNDLREPPHCSTCSCGMTVPDSRISVVQMIQALRGCVQQLNQSDDHKAALKAQQTLLCLDELDRELRSVGGDDMPYEPFPFVRTQYEIDREREIREEQEAREQES